MRKGFHALFHCFCNGRARIFNAEAVHRFAEQFAVLGHLDGFAVCTDQLDVEFVQNAHVIKRQRRVQTCLATHGWQQRIGALFFNDLGHDFGSDRLDIGRICHIRIGHNRGGV